MGLTKIQDIAIEKKLKELKNTYPKLKLITYEEYGRLWHPEIFLYSNKPRLYNEVTEKILQFLYDFHYAFFRLPNSYKRKILESRTFTDFIVYEVFQFAYNVDKKQKAVAPEDIFSYSLYLKFFDIGINGLISTMPSEFQEYLRSQINPTIKLMQAVAHYSKKINPKSMIPGIKVSKKLDGKTS